MVYLAIETSTRAGSIALVDGDAVQEVMLPPGDHAASLAMEVEKLVPDWSQVVGYGIAIGPGSFTGLRIGVAFLKGLAFVHRRPVVCVSTLETIEVQLQEAHRDAVGHLPILDARNGEIFTRYGDVISEGRHPMQVLESLDPTGIVAGGDASVLTLPIPITCDPLQRTPRASVVGRIAQKAHLAGKGVDALQVEPVYHQPSAAEAKRMGAGSIPDW